MSRSKGLSFCHEVKKILESEGHIVDGPFFKPIWFGGKSQVVHKDVLGIGDLISYRKYVYSAGGMFYIHQVTDLSNKAIHIKAVEEKGIPTWVWCRCKEGSKVQYRVFICDNGKVLEDIPKWKVTDAVSVEARRSKG